jgi:CheY-like chemotaxis protein
MRPKKRVVVLDENEVSLAIRCFALETWGYAVIPARTAEELAARLGEGQMDAVIAVLPRYEHLAVLKLAQALSTPVMSLDLVANAPGSPANVSLASTAAPVEIREALRILAARKRGPKTHVARAAEAELARVS